MARPNENTGDAAAILHPDTRPPLFQDGCRVKDCPLVVFRISIRPWHATKEIKKIRRQSEILVRGSGKSFLKNYSSVFY